MKAQINCDKNSLGNGYLYLHSKALKILIPHKQEERHHSEVI